jgi:2-phosphosulfolactate phosphatase
MRIQRATLDTCAQATGVVVVIDVIRAFTTAAFAFAAGAQDIAPVGTVEEALALRKHIPNALAMGEVHGLHVEGFDFGNSPSALVGLDLAGRHLIQRTSAGTQGVVRSVQADALLAASLCCARATARYITRLAPECVTFVITGFRSDGLGDEDAACADYIEGLLHGGAPDTGLFIQRVRNSPEGHIFADPARPEFPAADLECCVDIDRFDFAMPVNRRNGRLVMEAMK